MKLRGKRKVLTLSRYAITNGAFSIMKYTPGSSATDLSTSSFPTVRKRRKEHESL